MDFSLNCNFTPVSMKTKRRNFIVGAVYTLPLMIFGTLAASIGTYLFGKPDVQSDDWTEAGDLSSLTRGTPQQISFEKRLEDGWKIDSQKASAWVIVDGNRQVTAFSPLCTHLGCAYRWQAETKAFACPCHGSAFDIHGNVIAGPAGRPLDRYLVRIEGSRLWLGPIQQKNT